MPRRLEKLSANSLTISGPSTLTDITLSKTTVSQGTSLTTGVSLDSPAGFIFTFTTGSISTSGSNSFTVTNSFVNTSSIVHTSILNYTGSGIPVVNCTSITTGSFSVKINNLDATNTVAGSVKLGFTIF